MEQTGQRIESLLNKVDTELVGIKTTVKEEKEARESQSFVTRVFTLVAVCSLGLMVFIFWRNDRADERAACLRGNDTRTSINQTNNAVSSLHNTLTEMINFIEPISTSENGQEFVLFSREQLALSLEQIEAARLELRNCESL